VDAVGQALKIERFSVGKGDGFIRIEDGVEGNGMLDLHLEVGR
jgi:hypothetical protein